MSVRVVVLDDWFVSPNGTVAPRLFYAHPEMGGDDVSGRNAPSIPLADGTGRTVLVECLISPEQYAVLAADPGYGEAAILSADEVIDEAIEG